MKTTKYQVIRVPFQKDWAVMETITETYDGGETITENVVLQGTISDCYAYIKLQEDNYLK